MTRIKCEKISWVFWAKIPLGGCKGYVTDEWGSYACARAIRITVWVVSKNKSNFLLENKTVSALIWRHVRLVYMLFTQTFYGLLFSYFTITDVTSYAHHKFPVSFLLYIATKKLKQTITVNSSTNAPTTKNNTCTLCVPMFILYWIV